jgi:hypothetical protein
MRKGKTMVYATIEDIRGYLSEDDLASLTDDDAIMNTAAEMAAGASVNSKSLTKEALTNINCVLAIEALYLRRNLSDTLTAWEPRIRAARQQIMEVGGDRMDIKTVISNVDIDAALIVIEHQLITGAHVIPALTFDGVDVEETKNVCREAISLLRSKSEAMDAAIVAKWEAGFEDGKC